MDSVLVMVMGNRDTKGIFNGSEVQNFPMLVQLGFKGGIFFGGSGCGNNVINMYSKDGYTHVSLSVVNTPFVGKLFKSHFRNCFVKGKVSHVACLFHTIETLHEFHHPVTFTWFLKPRRLLHIDCFIFWKDTVEESSFDVKVLDIPIKSSNDVEQAAE
jgi:hypothetical protein